ncbi:hypothetical protein COLO4_27605 [Corchorus olitorius]|uniref:Uncharacterized protein n=1 Tax=Corchorus olitorius TaxID=93759 RepID=A0A1R3HQ92_9ROSI|nr:hypothetical protein COLO4_27605 [Corchorus olitorius]
MGGNPWKAGKFSLSFCLSLWSEHLGLHRGEINQIIDPISDSSYKDIWVATAKVRTGTIQAERQFLEAEYDEYAASNASGAVFCRSAALIVLHDAFFKYQAKPKLTTHGYFYHEGKNLGFSKVSVSWTAADLIHQFPNDTLSVILDNLSLIVTHKKVGSGVSYCSSVCYHIGLEGQYSGSKEESFLFTTIWHARSSIIGIYNLTSRIVGFEVKPCSKPGNEGKRERKLV